MIHIVVEGLDGTGKSTLVKALHERLLSDQAFCQWIYADKEPGTSVEAMAGIKFNRPGINVRELVLNEKSLTAFERELLFYVDASQHRSFIQNQNNAIIISDRGLWSHLAYLYATMKTKQIDYEQYRLLRTVINHTCSQPDFVIYLKGDLALMKERNANKTKDLIESNGDLFFEAVEMTYENLIIEPKYNTGNCVVLDARNSTSHNVESVVNSLKESFSDDELKSGNISVC